MNKVHPNKGEINKFTCNKVNFFILLKEFLFRGRIYIIVNYGIGS